MNPSEPLSPDDRSSAPSPRQTPTSAGHSRRVFLFKLSLLLNGAVGAVLAVPIVGYLLGPALRKSSSRKLLDRPRPAQQFSRRRNPPRQLPQPRHHRMGRADRRHSLLGPPHLRATIFRSSPSTARISAARCAGSRSRSLFLCPCHGGAYYEDGSRASGPPERGLFEYQHKIVSGNLMISAGKMPTLAAARNCAGPRAHADSDQLRTRRRQTSTKRPRKRNRETAHGRPEATRHRRLQLVRAAARPRRARHRSRRARGPVAAPRAGGMSSAAPPP